MCFATQRRALFQHLNFQKCSEDGVLCTFWLQNVLRATTAWFFLTSQLPKVLRAWGALTPFTSKCASRHSGVQFFISHLPSWLRTRIFILLTFFISDLFRGCDPWLWCFSICPYCRKFSFHTSFDKPIHGLLQVSSVSAMHISTSFFCTKETFHAV